MKIWIYITRRKEVELVVKDGTKPYYIISPYRLRVCHFWKRKNKKIRVRGDWFSINKSFVYVSSKFPEEAKKIIYYVRADYFYLHEILGILKKKKVKI